MEKELPKSFEELIKTHDKPVLVDFWAEWCGPCRMLSPIIEQLAGEWKDKITVIKINTDDNQVIAHKYNIQSIPTVILFKNGEVAKRVSGAMPLNQLKKQFESLV